MWAAVPRQSGRRVCMGDGTTTVRQKCITLCWHWYKYVGQQCMCIWRWPTDCQLREIGLCCLCPCHTYTSRYQELVTSGWQHTLPGGIGIHFRHLRGTFNHTEVTAHKKTAHVIPQMLEVDVIEVCCDNTCICVIEVCCDNTCVCVRSVLC